MTTDQGRLERVCRRADELLWAAYRHSLIGEGGEPAAHAAPTRIVFPLKGTERRVGKQEARLAFVAALVGGEPADAAGAGEPGDDDSGGGAAGWGVAVEAPTRLSYRMAQRGAGPESRRDAGSKAQRGLHDLALFGRDDITPELVVEFESGGRSGHAARDDNLMRDVAMILAEQPDALWFHVVRSAGGTPLCELLAALDAAISTLSNPLKLARYTAAGKQVAPRAKTVAFHVSLLDPGVCVSLHRVLDYVPGKPARDFFTIEGKLPGAVPGGWTLHREG